MDPHPELYGIIAFAVLGGLAIVVGLPVWLGVQYARKERELEHAERMRALELGQKLPKDEAWWTPIRLCVAIGAGMPTVVSVMALAGTLIDEHNDAIWPSAAAIGVSGVVCGTFLATRLVGTQGAGSRVDVKPAHDPDAFDVVARRG